MMDAFDISASAMSAQRLRLDVIASNLANVNTTRQNDGSVAPYRRRNVVFAPILNNSMQQGSQGGASVMMKTSSHSHMGGAQVSFNNGVPTLKASISHSSGFQGAGVKVVQVTEDMKTPLKQVFDPSHPDADENGYVNMPNINPVSEMVDMIAATRAYEANVSSVQASKSMHKAALEI